MGLHEKMAEDAALFRPTSAEQFHNFRKIKNTAGLPIAWLMAGNPAVWRLRAG
jgi:hypothetical protein